MKFERENPIGLDARRKKRQGGLRKPPPPPPPMGLGLRGVYVLTQKFNAKAIVDEVNKLSLERACGKRDVYKASVTHKYNFSLMKKALQTLEHSRNKGMHYKT